MIDPKLRAIYYIMLKHNGGHDGGALNEVCCSIRRLGPLYFAADEDGREMVTIDDLLKALQ